MSCIDRLCTDLFDSFERSVVWMHDIVAIPHLHFTWHLYFINSNWEFNCNFLICCYCHWVSLALIEWLLIDDNRFLVDIILDANSLISWHRLHRNHNRLSWRESFLEESLKHLPFRMERLTEIFDEFAMSRTVEQTEKLNSWHHASELTAMFQGWVAIQHCLNHWSLFEGGIQRRVVGVNFLCFVEDLVQLNDHLINKLLLRCVFIVLLHISKEFNNHVASEQAIYWSSICHKSIKILDQLVEGPRTALNKL